MCFLNKRKIILKKNKTTTKITQQQKKLQVEGRVLSCLSKPNDNKRLQKKCHCFINFVCACKLLRVNSYEP